MNRPPATSSSGIIGMPAGIRHDICAIAILVAIGVAARLLLRDFPNFAPVTGIALFAGFIMKRAYLAILVPLGVMVISDQVLGGYNLVLMIVVYTMLAAPVCLRPFVRSLFSGTRSSWWRRGRSLMGMSVGASVAFFLVTNLAIWIQSAVGASAMAFYDASLLGLLHCYGQALPFFRYTLAGDLLFTTLLFGSWAVFMAWQEKSRQVERLTSNL